MPQTVNALRNPTFADGRARPRSWTFHGTGKSVRWRRGVADSSTPTAGLTVSCESPGASAFWSQEAVCKPGSFYRIEAVVTCKVVAGGQQNGFVLLVEPTKNGQPVGEKRISPALHRADRPVTVRATYEAPADVRRLNVSVGLSHAAGQLAIHEVRMIQVLEPDEMSHSLAIPEPPYTVTPPRVVRSVSICSRVANRPIQRLLGEYFGEQRTRHVQPSKLGPGSLTTDALFLPDPSPPSSIRSLAGLIKLARDRLVVISLPAFARLAGGHLRLRRIEQDDDPIFAKVVYANSATRGFALRDVFAYAWEGPTPGSYVQNQFWKTSVFNAFCRQHGFETMLASMCDREATSDRPICLFKSTPGGGLFVLDIEPAEADGSTIGEPVLAMHLLLAILGQPLVHLGQYAVPVRAEADFRSSLREMAARFEHFVVHNEDVPADQIASQLVTIGREDQSLGLPLRPKPVIMVRSGLTTGDVASVYSALVWIKQLVRMEPFVCPYVTELASRFRLAWIPAVAPWEAPDGFCRSGSPSSESFEVDLEDAQVAALIDVVSVPTNLARVVLPQLNGRYARYETWLNQLGVVFPPGFYFAPTVPDGADFTDRTRFTWQRIKPRITVAADSEAFMSDTHRDILAGGGEAIRIEIPGSDADFTAMSIHRTDVGATMLEHVIGLQFGLIAVNRQVTPVQLNGFPPVASGKALIVNQHDSMLQAGTSRVG
ncbi:MAG: hypothetical protein KJ749_04215 [Planctomycetes bacterium]|nr:hypothetical protein [Planctomycetota bacterium]